MKRILLTGQVERLAAWADAVLSVGWDAIEFPLIGIEELGLRPAAVLEPGAHFGWLLVTSRSALPFVQRLAALSPRIATRAGAVGEFATDRLRELGFDVPIAAARDAAHLAELVAACPAPSSTAAREPDAVEHERSVLWPRGDRAAELALALRSSGFTVHDPVVYASRALAASSAPPADAVFFASPSACAAWFASFDPHAMPDLAIAIGDTTFEALLAHQPTFARITRLAEPTPAALADALAHAQP